MFSENIHDVHKVTATHYRPENSHAVSFTVHGAGDIRKDITLFFGDTFGPNPDGAENANALFVALGGDHSMTTETDRLTELLAASEATRADLVNTIAELRAERDAYKKRGDNHWETLRSIRHMAQNGGDLERIILWVNDSRSGSFQTVEQTMVEANDARNEAIAERDAQSAEIDRLNSLLQLSRISLEAGK